MPILFFGSVLHCNFTLSLIFSNLFREYSTNSFSFFSKVSYPQILSMYSNDLSRLTAHMILGVPGSNLNGSQAGEYSCSLTQFMDHPQPNQGVSSFNKAFFQYRTHIQVSAIILCPVKTRKSHLISSTSTLKFGTAWLQSTTNNIFSE